MNPALNRKIASMDISKPLQNSLSILEAIEQFDPALFQVVYPRIYREPKRGSYYSPKYVASQMAQVALKVQQGMWGDNEKVEFHVCSQLVRFRVPTYYIGIGLMEALGKTKVKGEVEWRDMHMPFEAAVFLPPKGSLKHPTEGDLLFIGYARHKAGEDVRSKLLPQYTYCAANDYMTLFAMSAAGYFFHWNISAEFHGTSIALTDIDLALVGNAPQHRSSWPLRTEEMTEDDNKLIVRVAHYVFATLMVMTARPVLVAPAEMQKRIRKKSDLVREFWTCPVIGENYGIRYVRPDTVPPRPTGSHASPILHWVRGFTREQRYGPGRKNTKTVWIEPFMRGGQEEEVA